MQVDGTTYGIIPDTFNTILNNYLTTLQPTFPNANSPDSPIYTLAYVTATQDQLLQAALTSLWNAINANTAQGAGLNILANTVLNLDRPGLVPSSSQIQATVGPVYSNCQIQLNVTAVTGSVIVPIGWTATGPTTIAPYLTQTASAPITTPGIYYVTVYSTDTSTPVPASTFTGGDAISGLTFTVTNPSSATLGFFTIPASLQITASSLTPSPVYSPNEDLFFYAAGTYTFNAYSQDITTPVFAGQLNTYSALPGLLSVRNPWPATLGKAPLTDAQFNQLRRYYLNVEGQTYFGLEKAILDLDLPSLESIFIAETISENPNYSFLIVKVVVDASLGTVTLPVGWEVNPSDGFALLQSYSFPTSGTYYVPTYAASGAASVAIGTITSATPTVTGVTSIANLDPSISGDNLVPVGLGQRGYTIYLEYPTISVSMAVVQITVSSIGPNIPYEIPVGWQATGPMTTAPYLTTQTYQIGANGVYNITVYSDDTTTSVGIGAFTGGAPLSGFAFTVTNSAAAIVTNIFDVTDPDLQLIAATAFEYHPLGTQFYAAPVGSTTFQVPTPYSGYIGTVILNPFQTILASCNLEIIYNSDPDDAGYSNGVFNTALLPNLQTSILELINTYFGSKTLPTDMIYSINELSEIIQSQYTGIVALVGPSGSQFLFGQAVSPAPTAPPSPTRVFLRRTVGYNFSLLNANFTFSAVDKNLT